MSHPNKISPFFSWPALIMVFVMVLGTPAPALGQSLSSMGSGKSFSPLLLPQSNVPSRVQGSSFGTKSRKGPVFPQSSMLPSLGSGTGSSGAPKGALYQVHILGEVENPGTYRVPPSTRLSEAINLAGEISDYGSERFIQVRQEGARTKWYDLQAFKRLGRLSNNPFLHDGDVVFVPLRDRVVQIAGAVKRPDIYEIGKRKTSLKSLIRLAGGTTPGTSKEAPIKVIRYASGEKELIDVPSQDRKLATFYLENADTIIVPHIFTKDIKFDYKLPSLPGEEGLFYASFEERVFVLGGVAKPGPYPYSPHYSVREYLTLAGGVNRGGKAKKIYAVSPDGTRNKLKGDATINPGDTIVVPERYMRPETWLNLVLGVSGTALGITTTILSLTR